jgi:hypothetical protein
MQKGEQLHRKIVGKGKPIVRNYRSTVETTQTLENRTREGILNNQRLKTLLPWLEEYDDGYL